MSCQIVTSFHDKKIGEILEGKTPFSRNEKKVLASTAAYFTAASSIDT